MQDYLNRGRDSLSDLHSCSGLIDRSAASDRAKRLLTAISKEVCAMADSLPPRRRSIVLMNLAIFLQEIVDIVPLRESDELTGEELLAILKERISLPSEVEAAIRERMGEG